MTRWEASEICIYDVAIRADLQRQVIGRQLVAALRKLAAEAGIAEVYAPADEEDGHAIDFSRAIGGVEARVR